jgi:tetratricopeptide (TPR) repeat protein
MSKGAFTMKIQQITLIVVLVALCSVLTAWTQEIDAGKSRNVEQQVTSYFLQARQGDAVAAEKAVAMLEEAVAATPDNTALWNLLGRGYFMKLSALGKKGSGQAELLPIMQKAMNAFAQTLQRKPDDSNALSGHGMALAILGGIQQNKDTMAKGLHELNRAVEVDPKANHPRLTRAFTTVNYPPPIRSTPTVIEDIQFLIRNVGGYNPRAVDSLHIMLGDIYAEGGQTQQAKDEYQKAASESSTSRELAQSRLAALEKGSVPVEEIFRFRMGLGTQCTMCHGQ